MKVFYWKGKKNFGDLLTPLLINKFTHLDTEYVEPKNAKLISVGSIIDLLPYDWNGVIAGAGILHEHNEFHTESIILAVRGPLTFERIVHNNRKNVVLADPGLIADELVGPQEKLYNLGIIPHWTDKELEFNTEFLKYNPKIIRVGDDPLEVIRQIGQCRKIVSSSLHGIILADAFGIPRRIEIPPRALTHPHQEGGIFKWKDYSASIEMKLEIGVTQTASINIITEKQHELFDVFQEIKSIFS